MGLCVRPHHRQGRCLIYELSKAIGLSDGVLEFMMAFVGASVLLCGVVRLGLLWLGKSLNRTHTICLCVAYSRQLVTLVLHLCICIVCASVLLYLEQDTQVNIRPLYRHICNLLEDLTFN